MSTPYSETQEYHINLKKSDGARYVILTGDPDRCEKIAAFLENGTFTARNREFVTYKGSLSGQEVLVCSTGIGGPSAAIAMEELIHIGADTFIRIGTSGGMEKSVEAGSAVIATGAVRQEGTSYEYAPLTFPAVADFEVCAALKEAAVKNGVKYHMGIVQSKDSFYGQHSPSSMPTENTLLDNWQALIRCNVLASEMECAALFTVGSIRKARVGAVLAVMGNQTRRAEGLSDSIVHDTDYAIKTGVEAMKILIENDRKEF